MKVVKRTTTQLTLYYRPLENWLAAAVCIVIIPLLLFLLGQIFTWLFFIFWFPLLFGFFIILGFLILLFFGQAIAYIFDKDRSTIICQQRSLFKTTITELAITEIVDVQMEVLGWESDNNAPSQIILVFKGGKTWFLKTPRNSTAKDQASTVELIRDFLHLPPRQF
jgi:hypothetical protein